MRTARFGVNLPNLTDELDAADLLDYARRAEAFRQALFGMSAERFQRSLALGSPAACRALIEAYLEAGAEHPVLQPIGPHNLAKACDRAVKAAGIRRIPFHGLRHTHATLLLLANVNPKIVSERLGHASVAITLDLYSHVLLGMQDVAVRQLERVLGQPAGSAAQQA